MTEKFNTTKFWTPEREAELVRHVTEGRDAEYIAAVMGRTRQAVYNRAWLLGLPIQRAARAYRVTGSMPAGVRYQDITKAEARAITATARAQGTPQRHDRFSGQGCMARLCTETMGTDA